MSPLDAFRSRLAQYRIHNVLLGIDELNFYKQKVPPEELDDEGRLFVQASQEAHDREEEEAWRALDEAGKALEASERLNDELTETKQMLEGRRDELQEAYAAVEQQKKALEQQNEQLVTTQESLEQAKQKAVEDLRVAIERLQLQERLGLLVDRLKSQGSLLRTQNWLGPMVVASTGVLFWVTKEQIIGGAFVTLASMYLQTLSGNFGAFFGAHDSQREDRNKPKPG
jgi:predicted ribosome quality control (RQC) complex YloA/Tae2 family protein